MSVHLRAGGQCCHGIELSNRRLIVVVSWKVEWDCHPGVVHPVLRFRHQPEHFLHAEIGV